MTSWFMLSYVYGIHEYAIQVSYYEHVIWRYSYSKHWNYWIARKNRKKHCKKGCFFTYFVQSADLQKGPQPEANAVWEPWQGTCYECHNTAAGRERSRKTPQHTQPGGNCHGAFSCARPSAAVLQILMDTCRQVWLTDSGTDNFSCPNASWPGRVTITSPGHCCKTAPCPAATNEKPLSVSVL